jgi:hypothetical protein
VASQASSATSALNGIQTDVAKVTSSKRLLELYRESVVQRRVVQRPPSPLKPSDLSLLQRSDSPDAEASNDAEYEDYYDSVKENVSSNATEDNVTDEKSSGLDFLPTGDSEDDFSNTTSEVKKGVESALKNMMQFMAKTQAGESLIRDKACKESGNDTTNTSTSGDVPDGEAFKRIFEYMQRNVDLFVGDGPKDGSRRPGHRGNQPVGPQSTDKNEAPPAVWLLDEYANSSNSTGSDEADIGDPVGAAVFKAMSPGDAAQKAAKAVASVGKSRGDAAKAAGQAAWAVAASQGKSEEESAEASAFAAYMAAKNSVSSAEASVESTVEGNASDALSDAQKTADITRPQADHQPVAGPFAAGVANGSQSARVQAAGELAAQVAAAKWLTPEEASQTAKLAAEAAGGSSSECARAAAEAAGRVAAARGECSLESAEEAARAARLAGGSQSDAVDVAGDVAALAAWAEGESQAEIDEVRMRGRQAANASGDMSITQATAMTHAAGGSDTDMASTVTKASAILAKVQPDGKLATIVTKGANESKAEADGPQWSPVDAAKEAVKAAKGAGATSPQVAVAAAHAAGWVAAAKGELPEQIITQASDAAKAAGGSPSDVAKGTSEVRLWVSLAKGGTPGDITKEARVADFGEKSKKGHPPNGTHPQTNQTANSSTQEEAAGKAAGVAVAAKSKVGSPARAGEKARRVAEEAGGSRADAVKAAAAAATQASLKKGASYAKVAIDATQAAKAAGGLRSEVAKAAGHAVFKAAAATRRPPQDSAKVAANVVKASGGSQVDAAEIAGEAATEAAVALGDAPEKAGAEAREAVMAAGGSEEAANQAAGNASIKAAHAAKKV